MLYIIYTKYDITNRMIKTLKKKYTTIKAIEIPVTTKLYYLQKIAYKLNGYFNTNFFTQYSLSKEIKSITNNIKPNDKILFWDYYYYDDIKYLLNKSSIPINSTYLWIWNTINYYHLKTLDLIKQTGIKIYTFDPQDSIKYNIGLLNQVYYKEEIIKKDITYDFFFIGMDKGRSKLLNNLADLLDEKGYKYKFIIVKSENDFNDSSNKIEYIDQPIPYEKILNFISESRIIVDLIQCNQTGITLRTLEALFYEKKLLTNNPHIKQMDIYNPNNILFMDTNNDYKEELDSFINTKINTYKSEILSKYQIEEWIKKFL